MPSKNRIKVLRQRAFERQGGLCCYCGVRMWLNDPGELPGVPHEPAAWAKLQCTAEHLKARSEGGGNTTEDIAAACARCNHTRHKWRTVLEPSAYAGVVAQQMRRGTWHRRWVFRLGLVGQEGVCA